ncbi:MAG: radical SAM protein [Candidatus Omnitrophica bacterium]|nr:radical SAM protein [Candidatus Omnitrophota bacterium]MBU1924081.1 radical SAM protein [Candidatus Omnitrophota bacterium]
MCSIVDLLPSDEELSTEQIYRVVDGTASYGVKELLLTGGEPFLRKDLFSICDYSHAKGLRNIITTNGVLIDADMSERIAGSNLNHIHFSLDGLEETNDYYRGKHSFAKTIEAIKLLGKKRAAARNLSLGIAVTVMDENVPQLYDIVQLVDGLNVDVINFQPLISDNANFIDRKIPQNWVVAEKIPLLRDQIERIEKSAWKHITVLKEPRLELLIKYYQGTLKKADWVCFGGFKTVFVCFSKREPLVYTCHGICGNLNDISLKKAWTSREAQKLRMHSRNCRNLCIQSCYSREASGNLKNALDCKTRKGNNE